jgi:hypothetical protein
MDRFIKYFESIGYPFEVSCCLNIVRGLVRRFVWNSFFYYFGSKLGICMCNLNDLNIRIGREPAYLLYQKPSIADTYVP